MMQDAGNMHATAVMLLLPQWPASIKCMHLSDTHQLAEVGEQLGGVGHGGAGEVTDELRVALDEGSGRCASEEFWVPQYVLQEPNVCRKWHRVVQSFA
jgi:hypothetical protein